MLNPTTKPRVTLFFPKAMLHYASHVSTYGHSLGNSWRTYLKDLLLHLLHHKNMRFLNILATKQFVYFQSCNCIWGSHCWKPHYRTNHGPPARKYRLSFISQQYATRYFWYKQTHCYETWAMAHPKKLKKTLSEEISLLEKARQLDSQRADPFCTRCESGKDRCSI